MRFIRPAAFVALSILVSALTAQAQGLSITNYQKVSQQNLTANKANVTYRADLVNSGAALSSVTATVTGLDPFSVRVIQGQDTLNFSPVPANSQVTSSNTFTIQIDPTVPFDFNSKLQWTFQSTAGGPIANAGVNQTSNVGTTVTLDGSKSSNPSGVGTLTYSWAFTSTPTGSTAFLAHPNSVMPSFVIDVAGNYVITLTVSNGVSSSSASVTVSTFHTNPIANAGQNQTVGLNATVVLNGSGSTSPDGRPLTFAWTLTSAPSGSTAVLTGANTVSPSFVADKAGTYMIQLIVNDGLPSNPSTVAIGVQGVVKPVANAGPNQLVNVNTVVHLTGAASTDANGLTLTYQWNLITLPQGSTAQLTNPTSVTPTFVADQQGIYVAQLIVNNGSLNSDPSTVTITTQTPLGPTANAGQNQTVTLGATVTLNGSGTDPQNLPLTYKWTLTTRPAGSAAVLSSTTVQNPIFTADVTGTYIAQLVVNNGTQNSQPSTVTITTTCSQPTARPGQAQTVGVGATVTLNGSTSGDACNDPLTYSWTFTTRPAGSAATLTGANTASPTFVADLAGTYIVQLIVNNGLTSSSPAAVSITASTGLGIVFYPSSLSLTTAPYSVSVVLTSPAGAGGQIVNLTSNNPNIASVPGSVLVPAGLASVAFSVTPGNTSGTAIVTASAPGYASGDLTVTVTLPSLSVTLDSQTIGLSNTINGTVVLSAPAPSGATVTVSANPGGIVTINPVSVTIAPGSNVGAFTLTGAAVGGPVTITVSSPGYNSGSTQVTVSARGAITLPSTFSVAPNQTLNYPVSLVTGAPLGGVTLQLVSSDPSKVTVSPTVFIPFKATVPDVPAQVTGLTGGSVTITATAPGFVTGTGAVTVVNPAITVALDSSTVGVGVSINGVVTLSVPAAAATTVNISANPTGVVTVPATVQIAAGGTTGLFTVTGAAIGGPVAITASAPGYTSGSASVSVGSQGLGKITIPTNATVGTNQSVTFPVVLQTGAPAGGVTVSLVSSDPTKVVISPSSVFIPFKSTTPATQPQITGVNFGSASITASAPQFTGDTETVQVTATLSFSQNSLAVVLGGTQGTPLVLSSPAPAGGLTVNLVSSDPSKVTVPAAVSYAANTSQISVPVTAVANGAVTITASAPGLTPGTLNVNVITLGQIALPGNVSPNVGQTLTFPISLSSPAPAGGITVNLVSSDTSKVTVTSSVVVPQGSNTPTTQPQVTGVNIGAANITATANGYPAAIQQVKVPGAISFSPSSLTFTAGTSQNFTLNLSPAAPPGGLTVNLSSDNTSIATVPSTVTFSAGSVSVTFPVTGVSNGSTVIHASSVSIPDATGSVTIQTRGSILLPANVSVPQGQSAAFAVTLSAPAPAGGTTVSLVSSDTSKVTISPSSVTILQGAVSPASQPQVTGVAPGSATITGSSAGWTSGSQTVQVTNLTMSFSPSSQTLSGNSTANFALNLSAPAPAGGLTINLVSSNTGVATVPSTVSFTGGSTSVNVPVTGTGPGSATITASASNIASATASVTVQSDILLPANVSVLPGNVAAFPVTLTKAAPAGGIFLTLSSSNPQVLTVSPTNIFITQGGTVSNQPQVTGVANGSATVTVSGSGLSPASQIVTVGSGGTLTMSFAQSSITLNGGTTQNLTLNLSGAAPAGGIVVNLNSSNTGVATVPATVSISAGGTSASVPVTGIAGAGGQATITASASGIQSTTASVTVNGSVTPGISVSNVSVAVGQSASFAVTLGAAAPAGGVTVSLSSNNTAKATVTSSVFIAAGATTPASQPQVTGVASGTATITATAPGYTSGSGTATVNASGGSSSLTPGSQSVNVGSTATLTLNLSAAAPAGGVTATLTSSSPATATVPASVNIPAGATSANFLVTGVTVGVVSITANTPNFGSASATVTITAAPPPPSGIILPNVTTVQLGQTVSFPVSSSTPAPSGGVFITLSSSDTSKATVQPVNVFINQGGTVTNQPTLTGISAGTVTITASANGLGTVTQQVQVVSGASLSFSPSSISLTPGGSQGLTLTLPSAAPAGGLIITLSSSNPAVASVPATVSVNSFGTSVNVQVSAIATGSATITASLAGFGNGTANVTVTGASPIILPANVTLEPGDTVSFPVTLSSPSVGGAFINLTSSDTSKVTISPSAIFIADGQMSGTTPKITAVGFGTATITAQASGIGTASQQVIVGSSASFQPANLVIQGTATTKSLTLSLTAPAPAGGLVVNLSSSDTTVATVPSTVTIQANNTNVNVPVTSVSPGTTSIQASSLPVFPATAGTVTVVGAPSIILPAFQTVGIRNTAPLPVVLSTPAPAGGVTVNLVSTDTSKFTVTPSIFIAAGQTTSSTPVILTGGDFISSEGFANVTATATGYASASLQMHIGDAITISIPSNLTVGVGKSIPLPVALPGIAPTGGVTLTITSNNPGVATISATAFIPAGQNIPPTLPVLTGVAPGVVTIEASAASYTSAVQTVQVQ